MKHPHILFVVELVYGVLFLPLVMFPVVGWGALAALRNYINRLESQHA